MNSALAGCAFVFALRTSEWYVTDTLSIGPFFSKFSVESFAYSSIEEYYSTAVPLIVRVAFCASMVLNKYLSTLLIGVWIGTHYLLTHTYAQNSGVGYGPLLFVIGTALLFCKPKRRGGDTRSAPRSATRMHIPVILFAIVVWFALPLRSSTVVQREPIRPNTRLLISIDGAQYRAFANAWSTTNVSGFHLHEMNSTRVSKTLPAHWSIATGLEPDESGLIDNVIHDEKLGTFRFNGKNAREWWVGTPVWDVLDSIVYDWPGSNSYSYKSILTDDQKTHQLLASLSSKHELICTHFAEVDHVGHVHGPSSEEYAGAITKTIGRIEHIRATLEQIDPEAIVYIFIVGDHGMSDIAPSRIVSLDSLGVNKGDIRVNGKYGIGLNTHPPTLADRIRSLPVTLRTRVNSDHPRTPPVEVSALPGWMIGSSYGQRGYHGYDGRVYDDMRTIFLTNANVSHSHPNIKFTDIKNIIVNINGID